MASPDAPSSETHRAARDRLDRQLMLQAQRGDLEAFEALYEKYSRPIFNFFLRLCYDRQRAEDYMQDVYLRLWRSAARYHPTGKFTTYLFQIAKNVWLNERDKMKRRGRSASLDAPIGGGDAGGGDGSPTLGGVVAHTGDEGRSPADLVESQEINELLTAAIDSLDERHRLVFILGQINQFKYREIAEILDIPEGTVKTRMMHAERKLRDKLRVLDPDRDES